MSLSITSLLKLKIVITNAGYLAVCSDPIGTFGQVLCFNCACVKGCVLWVQCCEAGVVFVVGACVVNYVRDTSDVDG